MPTLLYLKYLQAIYPSFVIIGKPIGNETGEAFSEELS